MIRIVQIGLGPLGKKMVQFAAKREGLEIVGAVDTDPQKTGHDLGQWCGIGRRGVKIAADLPTALRKRRADVAVLTTVSSIEKLVPQVQAAAAAGLPVVSTCEELSFPLADHPEAAKKIDRLCRRHGVACVGTGVNPGYLMDYLPIVLTAPCQHVEHIEVQRVQDASHRRGPFQIKIGAGLTPAEFKRKVNEGTIRHVGLPESVQMIAWAMGWQLDETTEHISPVIASRAVRTEHVSVKPGLVAGVEQIGRGLIGGREVIRLHFRAAVGEKRPHDTIHIIGTPSISSSIVGGVNGDIATCAITLNVLPALIQAAPGLRVMPELAAPRWFR